MNSRQKAKDLVDLAVGEGNDKEKLVAAMRACQMIKKYSLLDSALDGLLEVDDENIQAAKTIFQALSDPDLISSVKKVARGFGRKKKR